MSSIIVYFNVWRAGVAITSIPTFPAQIDDMSQSEAAYYGGAGPYFRYNVYVYQISYDIRQEDLLVDLNNIDGKTLTYKQYRVINDPGGGPPGSFPDGHLEIVADRMIGT